MNQDTSDKSDMHLNKYQAAQMDRQIRIIEKTAQIIAIQHPHAKAGCEVLTTTTAKMSDILAGEGSDNNTQSAEPCDQPEYRKAVDHHLEKTCSELFEVESQQKMHPVFFSGEEEVEKSPSYPKKPGRNWEIRRPIKHDVVTSITGHRMTCNTTPLFPELSALSGYRWCQSKEA